MSESDKFNRHVSSKTPVSFMEKLEWKSQNGKNSRDSNDVVLRLAAEAENVKLIELVGLLNRRLDKQRNETDQISVR